MPPKESKSQASQTSVSELVVELFKSKSFLKEIRILAKTIAHEVADTAFTKLNELIERNEGRLHDIEVKMEEKSRRVEELEKELESKENRIEKLENTANDLQQYSRRSSLRVFGVTETPNENTDQLICDLAKDPLGIPLSVSDIDRSHRIGKHGGKHDRAIIVKFCSYRKRAEILKARRILKKSGITIQEDLTQQNAILYTKTYKHEKVLAAWTHDGRIIATVQATDGKSISKIIHSEKDLESL